MPPLLPSATAGPILAVDLGEHKSVAGADDRAAPAARLGTLTAGTDRAAALG